MIEYLEERLVDDMTEQLELFKKKKNIKNIIDLSKELGIYEYLEEYVKKQENSSKIKEINLKKEKEYSVKKNTLVKKIEILYKELNSISYNQKKELDILNRINKKDLNSS